jgi:cell division protein FtsN
MHQAEQEVLLALAGYERVRRDVLDRAFLSYLDLLESREVTEVLGGKLEASEEQTRVATLLVQHGMLLPQHLLDIEQGLSTTRQELSQTKGRATLAIASLNGLMMRPEAEPLSVLERRSVVEPPQEVRRAIQAAREKRAEIGEARMKVEEAAAGRGLLKTEQIRVDLRGSYGVSSESGKGDFLQGVSIGARLSAPLMILPLLKAKSDRQEAVVRQLELEVERLGSVVSVEAVHAYGELLNADSELRAAEKHVEATGEALRSAQALERWGEGGDRLSLIAAKVRDAEAARRAVMKSYTAQRASLKLQRAMGVPPEQILTQSVPQTRLRERKEQATQLGRALWVWRPTFLDKHQEMEFFVEFARARAINTLFLFASTKRLIEKPESFRAFLRLAHERKISVHALNGEPDWIFPERRSPLSAFIEAVLSYNRASPEEARFDQIHLDVEPHALPEWKSGKRDALALHYLDLLKWSRERTQDGKIALSVDIPDWFDEIPLGPSSLFERVLDQVDQVAVMAYRNRAQKVIEASRLEVEQSTQKGKTVWVGLSADPAHLPRAAGRPLDAELEELALLVESAFREQQSFLGVAIHDYERYRRLILINADTPAILSNGRPAPAPHSAQSNSLRYTIRIASYKTRAALDLRRAALEREGYRPYVVTVEVPGKGTWARLYVGPYSSFGEAMRALNQMREKGMSREAIVEREGAS